MHISTYITVTWKTQVLLYQLICVYFYLFLKHLGSSNISFIQFSALVTLAYTPGYPGVWKKDSNFLHIFNKVHISSPYRTTCTPRSHSNEYKKAILVYN